MPGLSPGGAAEGELQVWDEWRLIEIYPIGNCPPPDPIPRQDTPSLPHRQCREGGRGREWQRDCGQRRSIQRKAKLSHSSSGFEAINQFYLIFFALRQI